MCGLRMFAHCNDLSANYVATGIVQQKYLSTEISRRKLTKANSATNSLTMSHTHTHTHTRLTALCPGLPGSAGTRKAKSIRILLKWDSEWQWHQLGHMHVCTLRQTDNHASTQPLSFFRPDALPAAQPTVSKHWRQSLTMSHDAIKEL